MPADSTDRPELRCLACGYDLRGIEPRGEALLCPECGQSTTIIAIVEHFARRQRMQRAVALAAAAVVALIALGWLADQVVLRGIAPWLVAALAAAAVMGSLSSRKLRDSLPPAIWAAIGLTAGGIMAVALQQTHRSIGIITAVAAAIVVAVLLIDHYVMER